MTCHFGDLGSYADMPYHVKYPGPGAKKGQSLLSQHLKGQMLAQSGVPSWAVEARTMTCPLGLQRAQSRS